VEDVVWLPVFFSNCCGKLMGLMAVLGDTVLSLVFPRSGVLQASYFLQPTSVLDTEEPGDRWCLEEVIVVSISVVGEVFGGVRSCLLKWDAIEEDVWLLVPQVFRCLLWRFPPRLPLLADDDRVVEDLVVVMMECLKARVGGGC
jgi:hypothetical protein